jgi:hypothetical protein
MSPCCSLVERHKSFRGIFCLPSALKMAAVCFVDFVICNIVNSKSQQVEYCLHEVSPAVSHLFMNLINLKSFNKLSK